MIIKDAGIKIKAITFPNYSVSTTAVNKALSKNNTYIIQNTGAKSVFFTFDGIDSTTATGWELKPNETFPYKVYGCSSLSAICGATDTSTVQIAEVSTEL